ncbi:hypothetical protein [Cucumibacter marinus]|jgi:hypothetical protein|uniref:hypothetical protein n=1 Tax=Cucumibacter marinus TaxID=1121252 RepID=UPI0012DC863B|nr:hypothetical protein [Cucumibacter marinus]
MGQAEPNFRAGENTVSIEMTGVEIELARPDWVLPSVPAEDVAGHVRTYHDENDQGVALFEMIPVSETFETWTRLSAVLSIQQPGSTIASQEPMLAQAFVLNCAPSSLSLNKLPPQPGYEGASYVILCGEFTGTDTGTADGMGEILLAVILENEGGSVRFYEEFRGPAFSLENEGTWPISEQEITLRLAFMHLSARIGDAQDKN